VLASLGCISLLIAADQVHRAVAPKKAPARPTSRPKTGFVPRVGAMALNFQLPDARKKLHKLSDYKGQETVLTFFCGCSNCQDLAKQMVAAFSASHKSPPTVAVFASHWDPAATPKFVKETGASQFTYLYSQPDPSVMEKYHGTPCPAVYVLDKNQKIIFRSKRYAMADNVPNMTALARVLDLKYTPPRGRVNRHPVAIFDDVDDSPALAQPRTAPTASTTGRAN
jgi:peroxiredoxin